MNRLLVPGEVVGTMVQVVISDVAAGSARAIAGIATGADANTVVVVGASAAVVGVAAVVVASGTR